MENNNRKNTVTIQNNNNRKISANMRNNNNRNIVTNMHDINDDVSSRRKSAQSIAKTQRKTRKIIILGSSMSGKTMLVKRFLDNTYTEEYTQTVEDCYNRDIKYKGFNLNLDFIDMCGSAMFPAMLDLNIKSADIIMLTYEIDNTQSMNEAYSTYRKVQHLRSSTLAVSPTTVPIVLVGTKLDLHTKYSNVEEYEMSSSFYTSFHSIEVKHILTSAKTGNHVTDSFELGFDSVLSRINALSMSAIREEKYVKKECCVIL